MTLRITDFYLRGWSVKFFGLPRRVVGIMMMMIRKECRMMMKEGKRKEGKAMDKE